MCEALKDLMKPELEAAKADAESIGIAKGRLEGRNEATSELSTAIKRLKNGDSVQTLIDEGFDYGIVNSAKEVLDSIIA